MRGDDDLVGEAVDIGIWTFGLVAYAVAVVRVADNSGIPEAFMMAGILAALIGVLGVTGYRAVGSVDNLVAGWRSR